MVSDGGPGAAAAAALLLAGCGLGAPDPTPPAKVPVGVYAFTSTLPFRSGSIALEGMFEITQDTVLLVVRNAHCREVQGSLSSFNYQCSGAFTDVAVIHVNLARRNPLLYCGASAERRVPVEKEVCARWTVTKEGQRVCVLWRTEITYQTERRSAPLLVVRRTNPWR